MLWKVRVEKALRQATASYALWPLGWQAVKSTGGFSWSRHSSSKTSEDGSEQDLHLAMPGLSPEPSICAPVLTGHFCPYRQHFTGDQALPQLLGVAPPP
jgi:hypothetical protein